MICTRPMSARPERSRYGPSAYLYVLARWEREQGLAPEVENPLVALARAWTSAIGETDRLAALCGPGRHPKHGTLLRLDAAGLAEDADRRAYLDAGGTLPVPGKFKALGGGGRGVATLRSPEIARNSSLRVNCHFQPGAVLSLS